NAMGLRVTDRGKISTTVSRDEEVTRLRNRITELEVEARGRNRIEAALGESRDLFQSFMNNSPLLAYMKDEDGRYVYANRVIEGVLGDRLDRLRDWWGKTDSDLWPQKTAAELRANDLRALGANGTLKIAETLPQSDGEHQWMTFKFPFTTNSGKRYIAGISLDVTDVNRAEAEKAALLCREKAARADAESALTALRQSETRGRQLFDSNIIGIIEVDSDHVLDANDFFLEMTGYARDDLQERRLQWQDMAPAKYRAVGQHAFEELLAKGACSPFEIEIIRKDGTTLPILVGGAAIKNSAVARETGCTCLCFVLDLSERRQLENRLLHAQKLESLGLLTGGVAHDFNNMLASMMGNASLSLDALSPSHPAYRTLAEVVLASRRASDLTQQLLAYSGRAPFVIKPVDLSELVGEVSKLVEAVMSKKIDLRMNLARDLPRVDADSAQMQQVIMNLVINASEAIGENTGTVEVTTRAWEVTAENPAPLFAGSQVPPGSYAFLETRDTGSGMSKEMQARIFDPFFTTKPHGHGLGLAAVLGIVRGHNGFLRVESAEGEGTTFQLLFPASREQPAKTSVEENRKGLSGKGLVLVVDDEEAVRRMAKATLERYGYTVAVAENGKDGVDLFSKMGSQVCAVLLDMAMPVMNGKEAACRMVEMHPGTRVVMTSGYNEMEATDWIARQGLAGFIQKPYTATELAEQIKAAIES
ncbi:MAG: PAS domain S-box protein, partial [Acidobacteriota bacterium]|nr:PAS domain S-box protein [Acidobacteriota bacterium]